MERSVKWKKWDEVWNETKGIRESAAKKLVRAAHKKFGDVIFDDPATRMAVLTHLRMDYDLSMALVMAQPPANRKRGNKP